MRLFKSLIIYSHFKNVKYSIKKKTKFELNVNLSWLGKVILYTNYDKAKLKKKYLSWLFFVCELTQFGGLVKFYLNIFI